MVSIVAVISIGQLFFFLIKKIKFIYFTLCLVLLYGIFSPSVFGSYNREGRASDNLELELGMVVSYHMGAGEQTWVLWK